MASIFHLKTSMPRRAPLLRFRESLANSIRPGCAKARRTAKGGGGEREHDIVEHRRRAAQIEQIDVVALGYFEKQSAGTAEPSEMIEADASKLGESDGQQRKVNA